MNTKYRYLIKSFFVVIASVFFSHVMAQETEKSELQKWHLPDEVVSTENMVSTESYYEIDDTIPIRGTKYMIRVPKNWNGILLSDMDYRLAANSPRYTHLLKKGYAFSGTERRPERFTNYDPAHEIHDIISVLDIFEVHFGKPKYTIQLGGSGGGTITLAMAEIHPDRIDGGISACGATSMWMANTHMDCLFVLKALIAPELPIVNLPLSGPEIIEIGDAWNNAIKEAQATPEGRARIALAITIGQWPAWGGAWKEPFPEPQPEDIKKFQEGMYESLKVLLPSKTTFGTGMLEQSGPGQLRWNTGVDYKEFYNNGNADYKKVVESLYKEAKLDLNKELDKINELPRVEADTAALKWWSAPGRTHVGEPKVPLLRLHTSGDGLVYPSMAQGYKELVAEKGYSEQLRNIYVNGWGHCTFTLGEWLAAIETMVQRLEKGTWPDTSPAALNKLGKSIDSESEMRFYEYPGVTKYNRIWVPDSAIFR